jgi:hypothetical protein
MHLKDIKLTGLSITSNQDGSENLHISAAWGEGKNEEFYSREFTTKGTLTLEHLQAAIDRLVETAKGK